MISFSDFIRNNIVRTGTRYFAIIFIVLNISLLFVYRFYLTQSIIEREETFAQIVEELTSKQGFDFATDYMETYAETHKAAIKYYYYGVYVFESERTSRDYNQYFIGDGNFIYIDSSNSPSNSVYIWLMLVSSTVSIMIYFVSMLVYYRYSVTQAETILNDLGDMIININDRKFLFHKYYFREYQRIYDEFATMYNELSTSRLLKANKLQSITHDLKTSLTVSRTYLEGALNGRIELNDEAKERLLEEVRFTNSLVEALRDDSDNSQSDVNISNVLKRVLETFRSVYRTKNIRLKTLIRPDLIVSGDEESIYRIAQNLLSNSFYYSEKNTVVTVNLYKERKNIIFEVIDQGIGIPEDEIDNIFKKNYRVDSNSKHNPQGSGIGMYIVKVLCNDIGAQISVESDEGTTIRIKFSS